MRRLLVILLIALLPLQLSGAAVALACEGGVTLDHVSHVGHGAVSNAETDSAAEEQRSGPHDAFEAGCDQGHCHHHCHCVGIPCPVTAIPTWVGVERREALASDAATTQVPARPERPQWKPLA